MAAKTDSSSQNIQLTIVQAGKTPPCLQPSFGNCRGCFGWQAMMDAASSGDSVWRRTPIHCPVTGLTVKVSKKS